MMFGWGSKPPTPAQRHLNEVLTNESVHVLSTFELNRLASLTYGDEVCEEIFEMLEQIQAKPMEYSPLTVQKSLVVTKHILIYGSEKCVNSSIGLQRGVETLIEFNTVLWAQKMQGAAALMYKLKGGGVDQGLPVREAAKELWPLMLDTDKLRALRNSSADPNSLVPVGNQKVAFISDDVRHYWLKKRIQEQYQLQTKSNLVKEEGGFGSGYASKDGKMVVGAAHGLDEMIKQAERANRRFTDQGEIAPYEMPTFYDTEKMIKPASPMGVTSNNSNNNSKNSQGHSNGQSNTDTDLLSGGGTDSSSQPMVDLLDFGGPVSQPLGTTTADLLGTGDGLNHNPYAGGLTDLLGTGEAAPTAPLTSNISIFMDPTASEPSMLNPDITTIPAPTSFTGLPDLGLLSLADTGINSIPAPPIHDPFAAAPLPSVDDNIPSISITSPPMGDTSKENILGSSIMSNPVMSSNEDRFAALDSLDIPAARANSTSMSILSAKEVENKLLSATSDMSAAPAPVPPFTPLDNSAGIPGYGLTSEPPAIGFGMGIQLPTVDPMPTPAYADVGLKVSKLFHSHDFSSSYPSAAPDGEVDGFVMGGSFGSGLEPTAAAPTMAPPPPPPPPMY